MLNTKISIAIAHYSKTNSGQFDLSYFFFSIVSPIYSITIDTPAKLELLRRGHYNGKTDDLEITAAAHPEVFSLVEEFAKSTEFQEITFRTEYKPYNRIIISPANPAEIEISFNPSDHFWDYIPKYYKKYTIFYNGRAATAKDLDKLLQLQSATELRFFDNGQTALVMFQNAEKLRQLPALQKLYVWVNDVVMNRINVATFINNIPTLTHLHITAGGNYGEQLDDFCDKNRIDGWYYGGYPGDGEIYYDKK